MALAIFDLDNTLLDGDSDYLWGCFLVERGVVDGETYQRENQRFYEQYLAGCLDIREFLRFQLQPLATHTRHQLEQWREQFLSDKIDPILLPKARALLEKHRQQGDELLIISATNRFITGPIADRYAVPHLLATEPEMRDGEYTGGVDGTPCFQGGKVGSFGGAQLRVTLLGLLVDLFEILSMGRRSTEQQCGGQYTGKSLWHR